MSHKRTLLPCLFSILAAALTHSAAAITYNPYTQFSLTSNPNPPWSYGYGAVGSGPITLFTQTSGQFWVTNKDPNTVIGNLDGSYTGQTFPTGDLAMHPGDADSLASILVFTAPTSGIYSLAGLFERANTNNGAGSGVQVSICQDTLNCSLYSSFISSSMYLNNATFNLSKALTAGETLDFEVARTGGSNVYDGTALDLNIASMGGVAPTPEPSSIMLLGTGIAAICGVVNRRLRSRTFSR